MDVNEKIVNAWLISKDYFTIEGIDFGQFHSDIDLLAVSVRKKEILDLEIKIRTGSTKISSNDTRQSGFIHYVNQFTQPERVTRINGIVGTDHNYSIRKIFVTTYSFLGSERNRNKWLQKFKEFDIEVIFIEDIVGELESHAHSLRLSKNEIIQILRLKKIRDEM